MAMEGQTLKKEGFKMTTENTMRNVNKRPRIKARQWRRAG